MPLELTGYRVLTQLGVGARSTIHQIVRNTTGQFFALKRVVRRSAADDRFIEQAETEYEVASQVDHPALRKCIEIHRGKRWFRTTELRLVMELVSGETLERAKPDDIGRVIDLFRNGAEGLEALHRLGYVHADIKPNNIILTDKGEVKIIDFGQSCPIGHRKKRIQGTPDYIAPEQMRRLPLDERTDVYNLGATLYWALTGQSFPTEMAPASSSGHEIKGAKRTPKEIDPRIPAALSQLVMDCCSPTPDKRPASMTQFISRLTVARQLWERATAASASSDD